MLVLAVIAVLFVASCVAVVWFAVRHVSRISRTKRGVAELAPALGLAFAPRDPWGLERIGASIVRSPGQFENVSYGYLGGVAVAVGWWVTTSSGPVGSGPPTSQASTVAFAALPAPMPSCRFTRRGNRYEWTPGHDAAAARIVPVLMSTPLAVNAEVRDRWLIVGADQPGIHLTFNPLDVESTRVLVEVARAGAVALGTSSQIGSGQ